ncbi:hypothetical protein [Demequina activiva]|uniref:Uncharacterized protein n=1 Tax=Demequina activiva TaxID=1582364 RepID=A0A919UJG9_9MICO|nr:hypothetical protein [Demequina activiva]GIG54356.1 hypothetical protein Dac01nite_11080 [Demequina activiva]
MSTTRALTHRNGTVSIVTSSAAAGAFIALLTSWALSSPATADDEGLVDVDGLVTIGSHDGSGGASVDADVSILGAGERAEDLPVCLPPVEVDDDPQTGSDDDSRDGSGGVSVLDARVDADLLDGVLAGGARSGSGSGSGSGGSGSDSGSGSGSGDSGSGANGGSGGSGGSGNGSGSGDGGSDHDHGPLIDADVDVDVDGLLPAVTHHKNLLDVDLGAAVGGLLDADANVFVGDDQDDPALVDIDTSALLGLDR